MENLNQHHPKGEEMNPISRKTNEEIDEDESGNLIIGGKITGTNQQGDSFDDGGAKVNNNHNDSRNQSED